MSASEQAALYRLHAAQCVDIASRSADSETRLALLEMARSWRMLAEQADKNSQAVFYHTPDAPQHVAPQQPETEKAASAP